MITTFERGKMEGERSTVLRLLEAKFGPLTPAIRERTEKLPIDEPRPLAIELMTAQSRWKSLAGLEAAGRFADASD
jgi:hypothetical protein